MGSNDKDFERKYQVELSGNEISWVELGLRAFIQIFEMGNMMFRVNYPIPLETEINGLIDRLHKEYPQILKDEPETDPRLIEIGEELDNLKKVYEKRYAGRDV